MRCEADGRRPSAAQATERTDTHTPSPGQKEEGEEEKTDEGERVWRWEREDKPAAPQTDGRCNVARKLTRRRGEKRGGGVGSWKSGRWKLGDGEEEREEGGIGASGKGFSSQSNADTGPSAGQNDATTATGPQPPAARRPATNPNY